MKNTAGGPSDLMSNAFLTSRCFAAIAFGLLLTGTAANAESLYSEQRFRPLTADNKAFRVDDVITVQVYENASAAANADTATRRKNDVGGNLTVTRMAPIAANLNVAGDFDGGGRTSRAGKVLALLTVRVQEVLPSGDLRVAGEQLLVINGEQQRINLEGRVRPLDISDGNVVLSTRIADARITYVGEGDLSERQTRAWWRKVLDFLGL